MKKLFILFTLTIPTFSIADGSSVMQKVSDSMVAVVADLSQSNSRSGSGVIVMADEVLTNCHVVDKSEQIMVQFFDGTKMPATIKGRVGNLDLCALSVITNKRPKVKIAPLKSVKIGQKIFAVGNPLNLKLTISDGIVSALRNLEKNSLIQISAPISQGSSGGGVFDEQAHLIGITTFTLADGQNLNFAIPADYRNTIGIRPLEKNDSNSYSQKPITFKGIPFGVSISQFKSSFPSIECTDNFLGTVCHGGPFEYLGRIAKRFTIWFKNNKFYQVSVYFGSIDGVDIVTELESKIEGYFGKSTDKNYESGQVWWHPNEKHIIELESCEGFSTCRFSETAMVDITDGSIAQEEKNVRDF